MNIKKIADELQNFSDKNFESFIAEQFISSKSNHDEDPYFSFSSKDITIDVWKKNKNYEIIKSVIPGANKKAGKDFVKTMKKNDIIKEITKIIGDFLD